MELDPRGKVMLFWAIYLTAGAIAWKTGWLQTMRLGYLPGDFYYSKDGLEIDLPIATCLLTSFPYLFFRWISKRKE